MTRKILNYTFENDDNKITITIENGLMVGYLSHEVTEIILNTRLDNTFSIPEFIQMTSAINLFVIEYQTKRAKIDKEINEAIELLGDILD